MGFGGCTAWQMLEEGARVVITDIQDDRGEASAAEMRDAGYEAIYSRLDVTDESQWSEVVAQTVGAFGRLDILVNLAGAQDRGTLYDVDVDEWRKVMEISTTGLLLGTRAVIPAMTEGGGGAIVNLSSMAGKFAGRVWIGLRDVARRDAALHSGISDSIGEVWDTSELGVARLGSHAIHGAHLRGCFGTRLAIGAGAAGQMGRSRGDCERDLLLGLG